MGFIFRNDLYKSFINHLFKTVQIRNDLEILEDPVIASIDRFDLVFEGFPVVLLTPPHARRILKQTKVSF